MKQSVRRCLSATLALLMLLAAMSSATMEGLEDDTAIIAGEVLIDSDAVNDGIVSLYAEDAPAEVSIELGGEEEALVASAPIAAQEPGLATGDDEIEASEGEGDDAEAQTFTVAESDDQVIDLPDFVEEPVENDSEEGSEPTASVESNATSVDINATNFPDVTFRGYVQSKHDSNKDNALSSAEIAGVKAMDVSTYYGISSLKGIEYFTALEELQCSSISLTSLDVSKNTALKRLECWKIGTSMKTLKLGSIPLEELDCSANNLTSLDVSKCIKLKELNQCH